MTASFLVSLFSSPIPTLSFSVLSPSCLLALSLHEFLLLYFFLIIPLCLHLFISSLIKVSGIFKEGESWKASWRRWFLC